MGGRCGLLHGRHVLITGVASPDSIATATAAAAIAQGARVVVTALPRDLERARAACAHLPADEPVEPIAFDITDAHAVPALRDHLTDTVGHLDGALHAIAFAPRSALASITGVPSAALEVAMRTSVHSYAVLAELLSALAPARGASLVGLDFDASRAWPTYNWMGVCKAALESTNRYFARDLGGRRIRTNLIAAGPLTTRAASAIDDFDLLLGAWDGAPLLWDPADAGPVADAACFLLSDLARAVTGEILHVDGGHHAVAAGAAR